MQLLKVTFRLAGKYIPPEIGGGIHLDGLLAAMKVARAIQNKEIGPGGDIRSLQSLDGIIDVAKYEDSNVYKASIIRVPTIDSEQLTLTRRTEIDAICLGTVGEGGFLLNNGNKNKIDLGKGQYRNWVFYLPTSEVMGEAIAYCVGDKDKIEDLLRDVRHIGRKGTIGYGKVMAIKVEEALNDGDKWLDRHLPLEAEIVHMHVGESHAHSHGSITAPYWDRSLHQEILIPL